MQPSTVSGRLKLLLAQHVGLEGPEAKEFASHSLRRGGATYYAA